MWEQNIHPINDISYIHWKSSHIHRFERNYDDFEPICLYFWCRKMNTSLASIYDWSFGNSSKIKDACLGIPQNTHIFFFWVWAFYQKNYVYTGHMEVVQAFLKTLSYNMFKWSYLCKSFDFFQKFIFSCLCTILGRKKLKKN